MGFFQGTLEPPEWLACNRADIDPARIAHAFPADGGRTSYCGNLYREWERDWDVVNVHKSIPCLACRRRLHELVRSLEVGLEFDDITW